MTRAAISRLSEEVRILNDNIVHLKNGGESMSLWERNDLIAQIRRERAQICEALVILRTAELAGLPTFPPHEAFLEAAI